MAQEENDADHRSTLLHDLRGPVHNAKHLTLEINETMLSVLAIVESNPNGIDATQIDLIKELMSEDFGPCLKHLSQTITTLETRIQAYENSLD